MGTSLHFFFNDNRMHPSTLIDTINGEIADKTSVVYCQEIIATIYEESITLAIYKNGNNNICIAGIPPATEKNWKSEIHHFMALPSFPNSDEYPCLYQEWYDKGGLYWGTYKSTNVSDITITDGMIWNIRINDDLSVWLYWSEEIDKANAKVISYYNYEHKIIKQWTIETN